MQARNDWINAGWIAFVLEGRASLPAVPTYRVDIFHRTEDPLQLALSPRKSLANAGEPRHVISYYYPFLLWIALFLCLKEVTNQNLAGLQATGPVLVSPSNEPVCQVENDDDPRPQGTEVPIAGSAREQGSASAEAQR
jgi:hypothetical protein